MPRQRRAWPIAATLVTGLLIATAPLTPGFAAGGPNLAAGRPATASSSNGPYGTANLDDGDPSTYWESTNNALPQWAQVDLGAGTSIGQVVLKLPASWGARTETLSLQGSTDNATFTTVVAGTGYAFDPASGNTVTITFGATSTRYLRLTVTANTGWPAAQLSELEVYGPSTGDTQAPSAPGGLAFTEPTPGQVVLTWHASTDNVGVTGYDVYANNVLQTTVPGSALAYTDTEPLNATVTYFVRARDAAGNQSGNSNTVTRPGQTGDTQAPTAPGNLGYTQPQSGQIRLAWTASTDDVGVAAYDVYRNGALLTSVRGSALSYTDSQPDTATVTYVVKARDAAGNVSAPSNAVTRTGSGGANLAAGKPATGATVTFSVAIGNQGTVASAGGSHGVTLTLRDANGATVATLSGAFAGTIGAGSTAAPVTLGTWTAGNGRYTAHVVVAVDANELAVKQGNNTSDTPLFVGQGANMPYDMYEAEDGTTGGGATVVGPNRTIGDLAGEASGRKAVTLNTTGAFVQWTSRAPTNTFVVRFSIPDAPGGGGTTASLDLYVDGTLVQPLSLTSHYAWLYGAETGPGNSPGAGPPRHVYDEASFLLPSLYPRGSVIKLQKDGGNGSQYAIDFMNLEQASPVANPDPAHLAVPAGFGQQEVQNALDKVRMDTTGTWTGVYLPAGEYPVTGKLLVYQKPVRVVGAGVWYTRFTAPSGQENTDTGWDLQTGASGSSFGGFAWFGNYTSRQDGPGHTWDLRNQSNVTIDNVWIEHQVVGVWGAANVQNSRFTNMRIRDLMADGINLTNGSQGNLISNDEARSTGDDSFALFAALDQHSADLKNNTIQNVTALTPWRAAGVAVYGGYANTVQNFLVADTLCYSGLTISSLNFGFPFEGFGASPPTTIANFSLVRDGGHFWGDQVFGAVWVFSATQPFQGIRVTDATITSPTYSGIMFQTDYSGGTALNPVTDTIFTNTTITGAHQSGDQYTAKSGYGIWANPLPEPGQGPAVGSVTFNHLVESDNSVDIQNTTSTFTITVNP